MQKVVFTSSAGSIMFTDNDSATRLIDDYAPYHLLDFDPNSQSVNFDMQKCVDMDGEHQIGSLLAPKVISMKVAFDAVGYYPSNLRRSGGETGMYFFRREILKHFPLKEYGTLEYTNDRDTYYITAKMQEYPHIERVCGTMCQCTIFLVADYPYWRKEGEGNTYTATYAVPKAITIISNGDLASPIQGTITCVTPIGGNTSGTFFKLWQTEGGNAKMAFVKNLAAGEILTFNTGLNNEVWVKLTSGGTTRYANEYVDYRNSELLKNNVGKTKWQLNIYGTSGKLTIKMNYQNLFWAV